MRIELKRWIRTQANLDPQSSLKKSTSKSEIKKHVLSYYLSSGNGEPAAGPLLLADVQGDTAAALTVGGGRHL
jgi:hypothetical protein